MILQDDNSRLPLSRSYDLTIALVKDWRDPVELLIEDARKNEVLENYDTLVYDLTQTSVDSLLSLGSESVVQKYKPKLSSSSDPLLAQADGVDNTPIEVTIASFSNDGVATIRFSEPMKVPDIGDLTRSQVALRLTSAVK